MGVEAGLSIFWVVVELGWTFEIIVFMTSSSKEEWIWNRESLRPLTTAMVVWQSKWHSTYHGHISIRRIFHHVGMSNTKPMSETREKGRVDDG